MRNDKIFAVTYRDYQNRQHLTFCASDYEVKKLKENYEVTEVNHTDASFVPMNKYQTA